MGKCKLECIVCLTDTKLGIIHKDNFYCVCEVCLNMFIERGSLTDLIDRKIAKENKPMRLPSCKHGLLKDCSVCDIESWQEPGRLYKKDE